MKKLFLIIIAALLVSSCGMSLVAYEDYNEPYVSYFYIGDHAYYYHSPMYHRYVRPTPPAPRHHVRPAPPRPNNRPIPPSNKPKGNDRMVKPGGGHSGGPAHGNRPPQGGGAGPRRR